MRKNRRSQSRERDVTYEESARLSDARSRSSSSCCSSTMETPSLDTDSSLDPNLDIQNLNISLAALGVSPINSKKFRSHKAKTTKLDNIHQYLKQKFLTSDDDCEHSDNVGNDNEIIVELKEKFSKVNDFSEKVSILTVVPRSWSVRKIEKEFHCSFHIARKAKFLHETEGILSSPNPKLGRIVPDDVKSLVRNFYKSDDCSRVMPGKKDFVSVSVDGEKVHKQKRLVLCNLKELYRDFKERYPAQKIGFSKFAMLRPRECILAGSGGTHSVCVCTVHQNVKLMLQGSKIALLSQNEFPTYSSLIEKIVCFSSTEQCFLNCCPNCPGFDSLEETLQKLFDDNFISNLTYKQWIQTDRADLQTILSTPEEFLQTLKIKLLVLKKHDFIAKSQAKFLSDLKSNLRTGQFVVIGDFSENYSFLVQDAIQSYHWSNDQATLHPFVAYHMLDNQIVADSFVVISDCLIHNTTAVHLFQQKLIGFLKEKYGSRTLNKFFYFSDGAASQYKNKKNFVNLAHHRADFDCDAEWHFFATSHGKGPCDGIGGTVKRLAARASLQKLTSDHILTPLDLFNWAVENIKKIKFCFSTKEEHEEHDKNLEGRFLTAKAIKGTQQFHSYIPISENELSVKVFSLSDVSLNFKVAK